MRSSSLHKIRTLVEAVPALEYLEQELAAQLETFENRDRVAFDEWLGGEFAAEREELKVIEREIEILELAHVAADGGIFFAAPKNPAQAFVKAEQELREEFNREDASADGDENPAGDDPPEAMIDDMFETFLTEVRGIDPDELDPESYGRMRDEFATTFEHVKSGNRPAFEKAILRIGSDQSERNLSEAKVVFRRIVRELHPDRKEEFGEVEKKLWNEAMLFHEALDAEGLKLIEVRIKIHRHQTISPSEAPLVRRLQEKLMSRVSSLEQDLGEARAHPAWEFSNKKGRKTHLKSLSRGFVDCLQQAREHLQDLVESAMEYRAAAVRQARRKKAVAKKAVAKKAPSKKVPSKKAVARKNTPTAMAAGKSGANAAPASGRGHRSTDPNPSVVQEEFTF